MKKWTSTSNKNSKTPINNGSQLKTLRNLIKSVPIKSNTLFKTNMESTTLQLTPYLNLSNQQDGNRGKGISKLVIFFWIFVVVLFFIKIFNIKIGMSASGKLLVFDTSIAGSSPAIPTIKEKL